MNVGDGIETRDQLAALPVGTVLTYASHGWRYTKIGPNQWTDHNAGRTVNDTSFSMGGVNTIASLPGDRELVAVGTMAVGTNINVTRPGSTVTERWTRTAEGFRHEGRGVVLPTTFFEGAATAQSISIAPRFERPLVGECRALGGYANLIVSVEEVEGGLRVEHLRCWNTGLPIGFRTLILSSNEDPDVTLGTVLRDPVPDWYSNQWALVQILLAERGRTQAAPASDEAVRQARSEGVQSGRDLFRDEVGEAFQNAWDGVSWTFSEVNEVLDGLGCNRVSSVEDVTVTVSVDGTYEHEFDIADLEEMVNSGRGADVSETQALDIPFTYEFTIEREVEEGSCACGTLTDYEVGQHLTDNSVNHSTFTFEESCSND